MRLLKRLYETNLQRWVRRREVLRGTKRGPEAWKRFADELYLESEPVFFLSTGRCGTELLTRLFDETPGVACNHNEGPELIHSSVLAWRDGQQRFDAHVEAVRAGRFELMAEAKLRGRRYVETNCRITFFAPHLLSLFPRARFVHLVRHPGAFVRSAVRRGAYEGTYADMGRIRPYEGEAAERWNDWSSVQRCAWLWNETNAFVEEFASVVDPERMIRVTAEELFKEPRAFNQVLEHCGLALEDERKISSRIAKPVNADTSSGGLARYAEWSESEREELREQAELAERYGYKL